MTFTAYLFVREGGTPIPVSLGKRGRQNAVAATERLLRDNANAVYAELWRGDEPICAVRSVTHQRRSAA